MNNKIVGFLKNYSSDIHEIDSLLVSSFIYANKIKRVQNSFIKKYLILENKLEFSHVNEFLKISKLDSIELLIEAFECVISPGDKIVTGAVYTPLSIRNYIVESSLINTNYKQLKICDPACGCGGFLVTVALKIKENTKHTFNEIFSENLYGLDIQEYSVNRSKILLSLLAILNGEDQEFTFNFFQGNALNFDWNTVLDKFSGFSHVIGNPPYVCSRNIESESKELLKNWSVCLSGHPDLYIPFFQIGMENLQVNGTLAYITMNSFFKSINGRALRQFFEQQQYNFKIIDFGGNQVFQTKSTYTCICIIIKQTNTSLQYANIDNVLALNNRIKFQKISYLSLNAKKGWNLKNAILINKIENTGRPLGKLFKTRNGIATLKNDVYIFDPFRQDDKYFYLFDLKEFPIEKDACKEIINPNKLIRTDNIRMLKQKIIFPYFFQDEQVVLYSQDQFKNNYPFAYEYLLSKKKLLSERDKGKGKYTEWYAYGRNQSLEKLKNKLFFPHITPIIPNFVINSDENLLFHNGMALLSDGKAKLKFVQKLLSSTLFWFYIINSSKPYGSKYYSLSRNYIKNFGVYDFSEEDIYYITNETDKNLVDNFILEKYQVKI